MSFFDKYVGSMSLGETIGWLIGLIFGSLILGRLVKQSSWNLWLVILWHGSFNFFTASDRIGYVYPAVMSTLVILISIWIGIIYGRNLSIKHKSVQKTDFDGA